MSHHQCPLHLSPPGAPSGGAVILRPDFAARRRTEVGSPARLAAQADALFSAMVGRHRPAPAKPDATAAALAAIARGIEAASRPDLLPMALPTAGAATWQPVPFVDPGAGLAALSASLAAVTHPRDAL